VFWMVYQWQGGSLGGEYMEYMLNGGAVSGRSGAGVLAVWLGGSL